MARQSPQQLDLPCTFDETAQLKEEVTRLEHEVQWRGTKITALQEQLDDTKGALKYAFERERRLEAELTAAYAEIALLQSNLTVARLAVLNRAQTVPDWLSVDLRHLVPLAHPDKWSQGQEVSVTLNEIRQRLEEGMA
jgi:hypothetical protein